MPDIGASGVSLADVQAYLNGLGVGDVGTFTLATLPDPAIYTRRTIWVTDLWSQLPAAEQGGRMVSESGFWKVIRPLITGTIPVADMVTVPFRTPATLILGNAGLLGLGTVRTVTLGTGAGFAVPSPGYRQRIVKPRGALGTLNVVAALTAALTGWADYEFDGTAWQQTASGGLL